MKVADLIRLLREECPLDAEVCVLPEGAVSTNTVTGVELDGDAAILTCDEEGG